MTVLAAGVLGETIDLKRSLGIVTVLAGISLLSRETH